MSLDYTIANIFDELDGRNVKRIYCYNTSISPFSGGSDTYVGVTQNGQASILNQTISTTFTDVAGTSLDNVSWRIITSSLYVVDPSPGCRGDMYPCGVNQIYMFATGGVAAPNSDVGACLESRYRWTLSGDFDIQVDFSNWSRETDNTTGAAINITLISQTNPVQHLAYIQFLEWLAVGKWFARFLNTNGTQTDYVSVNVGAGTTSGKLRIVRVGVTLKFYYEIGGGWTQIGGDVDATGKIDADDVMVKLEHHCYNFAEVNNVLSNFTINGGTFLTSSGWYNETPSSQRGSTKIMPEHMLSIGSDSGVDLYDIEGSEFWMRFYTGSQNFFHLSGVGNQRPLDFSWSKLGNLYCAYGYIWPGVGASPQDGGLMNINFSDQSLCLHNTTGSAISSLDTGSYWSYAPWQDQPVTQEKIIVRNDNHGFDSGSSVYYKKNWGISNSCLISTDVYIPNEPHVLESTPIFWAGANEEGLRVYKQNVPLKTVFKNYNATASADHFIRNTRYLYCQFNQDNGDFHYCTNNDLYYIDYNTLSSSFTSSDNISTFTRVSSKPIGGTRNSYARSQYRFGKDTLNYFYFPAYEGIYRTDYNLNNSFSLYIAKIAGGGTFNILDHLYTSIDAIKLIYQPEMDRNYLLYGYKNATTDYGIGLVLLGIDAPYSRPRFLGNVSLIGISGTSQIQDIDCWKNENITPHEDKLYCFVAFTSSIYQLELDVQIPAGSEYGGGNSIGSDFTIYNYDYLPNQYTDERGIILDSVPYFLNTPIASLRFRNCPLSSSIQIQETKYLKLPVIYQTGSF